MFEQIQQLMDKEFGSVKVREKSMRMALTAAGWTMTLDTHTASYWIPPNAPINTKGLRCDIAFSRI